MLINNYICSINYTEMDLKKQSYKLLTKMLDKDQANRPSARGALEDDVFCISESAIQLDLDFLDNKFVDAARSEVYTRRTKTKGELEDMFRIRKYL